MTNFHKVWLRTTGCGRSSVKKSLAPQKDQLMSERRSASSRLFDLNGAAKTAITKHSSAIMVR